MNPHEPSSSAAPVSFTHIINPFLAAPGSEHAHAQTVTFASLRAAIDRAANHGIQVQLSAVVLPGEEAAAEPPAELAPRLARTVQDLQRIEPMRPMPLIGDILELGARDARGDYLVFTNMDIILHPDFYRVLDELIRHRFGPQTPFNVYRRNLSVRSGGVDPLTNVASATTSDGTLATGYDCFVFPRNLVGELDLGDSCIGSGHFDYLFAMALDAASGFRFQRVVDKPITFHIGNELGWTRQIDYLEYNLYQALAAIERMERRHDVPPDSVFAGLNQGHFKPNASNLSRVFRRLKRHPVIGELAYRFKKAMGRNH